LPIIIVASDRGWSFFIHLLAMFSGQSSRSESWIIQVTGPPHKLKKVKELIQQATHVKWLSLKMWESLAGKMNFAAHEIFGVTRRCLNAIGQHREAVGISTMARRISIGGWRSWGSRMSTTCCWTGRRSQRPSSPQTCQTAQRGSEEVGLQYKGIVCLPVTISQWGQRLSRKHLLFTTTVLRVALDSSTTVAWLNTGSAQNNEAMVLLRGIFWWSTTLGFLVTCSHLSGEKNTIAHAVLLGV